MVLSELKIRPSNDDIKIEATAWSGSRQSAAHFEQLVSLSSKEGRRI